MSQIIPFHLQKIIDDAIWCISVSSHFKKSTFSFEYHADHDFWSIRIEAASLNDLASLYEQCITYLCGACVLESENQNKERQRLTGISKCTQAGFVLMAT